MACLAGIEMTDIRRADPAARRRAGLFIGIAMIIGALVLIALEHYRVPLREWLLAEAGKTGERVGLIILLFAAISVTPLLAFAAYAWSLGGRILRAREFPPPGVSVIRGTRVIRGEAADSRGRRLRLLAVACGIGAVALGFLLWRLASMFSENVA